MSVIPVESKSDVSNGRGEEHKWDSVERTTRPAGAAVDGVELLTIIRNKPNNPAPHLVLVLQFRPATGKVMVEFPAGLLDAGETPEVAATRELAEETGC